jgi:hypothetical protein
MNCQPLKKSISRLGLGKKIPALATDLSKLKMAKVNGTKRKALLDSISLLIILRLDKILL